MAAINQDDEPPTSSGSHMNRPVFIISAVTILGISLWGVLDPVLAGEVFAAVQSWIIDNLGWFYALAIAVFLVFCLILGLGPLGQIKLGPDHSEPEFGYISWFAMLFSAGMGIGLMFFGVAEPLTHFDSPPLGEGGTPEAARQAVVLTIFHWGIHGWAVYAVVGLALAFFSFRHDLPLSLRSALYPLIGERFNGPIGHAVDIFSVVGTMFGIATSLGLGAFQINAGLNFLFGLEETVIAQLVIIAAITLMATVSAVAGLDAGIKRLSELNILLALLILFVVIAFGPTVFLAQALLQNTGSYLGSFIERTFMLYVFEPTDWVGDWTLFYWAWWMSWSPFVGMFIARISRGRTIREFIAGVILVPTLVTAIWFTAFGNAAIAFAMEGATELTDAAINNTPVALFLFLQHFPFPQVTSVLATLLVVTFFVTSADSGALVIDTITAGGSEDAPVWQRIFWAISEGVVASALLLAGGLTALQTATLLGALPFTIALLFVCYGLYRGLALERARRISSQKPRRPALAGTPSLNWQRRLANILSHPTKADAQKYIKETVEPALADVAKELQSRGIEAETSAAEGEAQLRAGEEDEATEFRYSVQMRRYAIPGYALGALAQEHNERQHYYRAEVYLREGGKSYDLMGYSKEQVIADVLSQYERHLHVLELVD